MQKKNIFKALAFAMLMPAMMLTTACSSQDDVANINNEPTVKKGYALPVTVNVTRQGDATTRATFDGSKLNFSAGDKLFVSGNDNSVGGAGQFAGTLDYVSEGTFSGTIYTPEEWTGTADALFTAASKGENLTATLLPNGYDEGSNSFLSINNNSTTDIAYDDRLTVSYSNAFVASETAKATGVEQLSLEQASTYDNGFALTPQCAILNFTISGLAAGAQDVTLNVVKGTDYTVTGSVTPNASGVATFAIGVSGGSIIKEMSNNLTVGSSNFTLPSSTTFAVGKIYNIARNAIPGALIGQFSVSADKKVYFSKGNLQYDGTNWKFAASQWEVLGVNGTGANGTATNYPMDLFTWGYIDSPTCNGTTYYTGNADLSGITDWGSRMGSGWCTLSRDEWRYLFAENEYGYATVNGVYGIIFLPDAFVDPNKNNDSEAFVGSTTDWDDNLYTEENWALMEKNGAVFLPAAGYREGADVDVAGERGYYWSSSANGDVNAHYVYFNLDDLVVDEYTTSRYNGMSVRLVRDVAAPAPAYTMAAAATTSDKGKLICTAGHIHVYGEDAACTAGRVAKIIYVGSTGHATYNHGLALALEDMSTSLTWDNSGANNDGKTAAEWCSAWNTSKPVTDADWLLASKDQWDYMLGANGAGSYTTLLGGFTSVGGSNLQSGSYWSSTEVDSGNAWLYYFVDGYWLNDNKYLDYQVRACLAF